MHPTHRVHRRIDREVIAYGLAIVVLIVSGALLKSIVLNWIVGPGLVVVIVVATLALFRRLDGEASS